MLERRRLVAVLIALFVVVPLGVTFAGDLRRVETCTSPAKALRVGDTVACVHSDEAPPGVDVTDHVSTQELASRPGAGAAAYAAAQELGVAATPVQVATTASSPAVTCDGDGTSGYRVQAMYVVEAGRTNRYASLQSSFQLWAAGTDDVVNRSAALTGGVRHIRYVTDPGSGGTCVANVLNVTVPAGSLASFGSTISAVQALGYTSAGRKYLMWTDATSLCGVATMYTNDGATQANPNNGAYAQYARVDSGCWGLGDGSNQHSVEAHELLHTFGGVQNTAPHSTAAGHCWDESDTMCYADGGNHAMVQVCTADHEFFYDCNSDDYFSTYPDPGGYLAGHWNSANSRFLIGGGDGAGGGTLGTPTTLGATLAVNNPAVPGLSTQATVAPALPTGRTLTGVQWKAGRSDCAFGTPTEVQTTVTCAATGTTATTVTVTLTDSTGATKAVTSPLTFSTGTARPVQLAVNAAGQSGSVASVCTGASFPLVGQAVDAATGAPIKGLSVVFKKKTAAMLAPGGAGSAVTTISGAATLAQTATVATDYTASTVAGTVYAAGTSASQSSVPEKCAPTLTGVTDTAATYYADPVTVTGTLTRTVGGSTVGVAGASVPIKLTSVSGTVTTISTLGTAVTATDGSYRLVVKPIRSGDLSAELVGSASYVATKIALGSVVVTLPDTLITGAVDKTDVGYGNPSTVSGTLNRDAGGTVTALKGQSVGVTVTVPGKVATRVASATVTAAGTFSVAVPLKVSGALAVVYAGVAGQPAASVDLGNVVAGTWDTALTASASAGSVLLGGSVTISGSLTRTYAGVTGPAAALRVNLYFTPTGSSVATLTAGGTTTATGTFTAKVYPKVTGTWTAVLSTTAGYAPASTAPMGITVG